MASGYEINLNAFQQYTMDTAKLYVKLYPWYYILHQEIQFERCI